MDFARLRVAWDESTVPRDLASELVVEGLPSGLSREGDIDVADVGFVLAEGDELLDVGLRHAASYEVNVFRIQLVLPEASAQVLVRQCCALPESRSGLSGSVLLATSETTYRRCRTITNWPCSGGLCVPAISPPRYPTVPCR